MPNPHVFLLSFVLLLAGCHLVKAPPELTLADTIKEDAKSAHAPSAIATLNTYQQALCANGLQNKILREYNKSTELTVIKDLLKSGNNDIRMTALKTLIACQAEGINLIVIEHFQNEKDFDKQLQILRIVATYANIALQSEMGVRALQDSSAALGILGYNYIAYPAHRARLNSPDESLKLSALEWLEAEAHAANPLVAATALRQLRLLNRLDIEHGILENFRAHPNKQIAMALALSGTTAAKPEYQDWVGNLGPLTRYGQLGRIATGEIAPQQVDAYTDKDDPVQLYERIQVLLSAATPEALDHFVKIYKNSTSTLQHYMISTFSEPNHWTPQQLSEIFLASNITDKFMMAQLLQDRTDLLNQLILEAFKKAIQQENPQTLSSLTTFIERSLTNANAIALLKPIIPKLEAVLKDSPDPSTLETVTKLKALIAFMEEDALLTPEKIKGKNLDLLYPMVLLSGHKRSLDANISLHLSRSDFYYIRLLNMIFENAYAEDKK